MDSGSIMMGLLWGAVGSAYFIYGKKQGRMMPMLSGALLCVFPYFVPGVWLSLLVGLLLSALPFWLTF